MGGSGVGLLIDKFSNTEATKIALNKPLLEFLTAFLIYDFNSILKTSDVVTHAVNVGHLRNQDQDDM